MQLSHPGTASQHRVWLSEKLNITHSHSSRSWGFTDRALGGNYGLEPVEKLRTFAKSPHACKDGHRRGRDPGATAINPELCFVSLLI